MAEKYLDYEGLSRYHTQLAGGTLDGTPVNGLINDNIEASLENFAAQDIADAYSSSHTYAAGDYVTYKSILFKSKVANNLNHTPVTSGSTDNYWQAVQVMEEVAGAFPAQDAHNVFVGPASGSAAAPSFRLLVASDIPDLSGTYIARSVLTTAGDFLVASDAGTPSRLGIGSANTVLSVASDGEGYSWKDVDTTVTQNSSNLVTSGAVWTAIDNLPEPMVFKGSVGDAGDSPTITWANLPAAASSNEGYTYKVITAHATAPVCKVGDTIISNGSSWVVIPSGDEPSGTVTSVALTMPTGFTVTGSPITSSGTLTVTLASGYSLLTDSDQTINGTKTFSTGTEFTGSAEVGSGTKTTIYGDVITNVQSNTTYAYYFPAQGGTFALTSDIPSTSNFVTLDGNQTITGVKTFDNYNGGKVATTSSGNDSHNYHTTELLPSGFKHIVVASDQSTQYTITLPSATGTLALTSDLANYVTTNTAQNITGEKTFYDDIHLSWSDDELVGILFEADNDGYLKLISTYGDSGDTGTAILSKPGTIAMTDDITITGVTDGMFDLNVSSKNITVAPYSTHQTTAGRFDSSNTAPSGTTRLNYDGYLYATTFYATSTSGAVELPSVKITTSEIDTLFS